MTKRKTKIKVGSDFSGVGAFEVALKRLGLDHEVVFACDIDKYARETYLANNDAPSYYPEDVYDRKIPKDSLDLYMTSPPCQSFSLAGKRGGEQDERGVLFYSSHAFIKKNRPRFFIFENVKGLLSDDEGKTFQRWLDYLAGSINGNAMLFPHAESVGYHIYWQILNSKDFGVPQNRERIFIIGIRDDEDNVFHFPKKEPLKLKLKDILQDNPQSKYLISKQRQERIEKSNRSLNFTDPNTKDIANCVIAGYHKMPTDGEYIKVDKKYFLSEKALKGVLNSTFNQQKDRIYKPDEISGALCARDYKDPKCVDTSSPKRLFGIFDKKDEPHQAGSVWDKDHISPALDTGQGGWRQPLIMNPELMRLPDLKLLAEKRVHDTPPEINDYLRKHKKGTIKSIAKKLDLPLTKVEHYFRSDKFRAIPTPEVWLKLKELLGFDDTYDTQVTDIYEEAYKFESALRLYSTEGLAQTLHTGETNYYANEDEADPRQQSLDFNTPPTTDPPKYNYGQEALNETLESSNLDKEDIKALDLYNRKAQDISPTLTEPNHNSLRLYNAGAIRKLTPRECFRLQDFPDSFKLPCSDTQSYKQAGNSITCSVLFNLIKQLKL